MRADITLVIIGFMLSVAVPCVAEEAPPAATLVNEVESDLPSMELLEFLGSWETEDGEWIDPFVLINLPLEGREPVDDEE